MHPRDVKSPVNRTRNHRRLYVSPRKGPEDCFSLCEAETYDQSKDRWELRVGIRWDGDRDNERDKGFPNTSGQAVWFWLPRPIERIVRAGLFGLEMADKIAKVTRKAKKQGPTPSPIIAEAA